MTQTSFLFMYSIKWKQTVLHDVILLRASLCNPVNEGFTVFIGNACFS